MKNAAILGRFNFLTIREDKYNVLFFPFTGTHAAVIARDLSRQTAFDLVAELNGGIDDIRRDLAELETDEY